MNTTRLDADTFYNEDKKLLDQFIAQLNDLRSTNQSQFENLLIYFEAINHWKVSNLAELNHILGQDPREHFRQKARVKLKDLDQDICACGFSFKQLLSEPLLTQAINTLNISNHYIEQLIQIKINQPSSFEKLCCYFDIIQNPKIVTLENLRKALLNNLDDEIKALACSTKHVLAQRIIKLGFSFTILKTDSLFASAISKVKLMNVIPLEQLSVLDDGLPTTDDLIKKHYDKLRALKSNNPNKFERVLFYHERVNRPGIILLADLHDSLRNDPNEDVRKNIPAAKSSLPRFMLNDCGYNFGDFKKGSHLDLAITKILNLDMQVQESNITQLQFLNEFNFPEGYANSPQLLLSSKVSDEQLEVIDSNQLDKFLDADNQFQL